MTETFRPAAEKRKQPRLDMSVSGRYMLANRREYRGTVVDASATGLALVGPERGTIGERVVVYIDEQIGRVEGEIVRHIPGGFGMRFRLPSRTGEVIGRLVTLVGRKQRKAKEAAE
jgi:hypothetical protein